MTLSIRSLGTEYDFRNNYLSLDGYRMHYLDEGAGLPLVMLHGNPTWSFLYRRFVRAFRDSHRVVAPDHVGCGLSDRPSDDRYEYSLSARVTDLETLLQHLGLKRDLTLFLHDWGGLIGIAYAARHPESVRRLVVFNTAAFLLPPGKSLHWSLRFCRNSRLAAFLILKFNAFPRVATRLGSPSRRMPREVRNAYIQACDSPESRRVTLRFVQDIPLSEHDPAYAPAQAASEALRHFVDDPVLICWGERDFVFDRDFLAEWTRRLPRAEVHRFPQAGHYVLEEAFESILPVVRGFLYRHSLT